MLQIFRNLYFQNLKIKQETIYPKQEVNDFKADPVSTAFVLFDIMEINQMDLIYLHVIKKTKYPRDEIGQQASSLQLVLISNNN